MKKIRYIDTSGFNVLVRIHEQCVRSRQRLVLVGLAPAIQRTVQILGLHNVVDITASVEVAKRWLDICLSDE